MDPTIMVLVLFFSGIIIASIGAMTGLGGGFLAVPFLIFAWGVERIDAVVISLVMILANSLSSSVYYLRARMVDLKLAALLSISAIPGLFLGYFLLRNMPSRVFDILFSLLLFAVTIYILVSRTRKEREAGRGYRQREGRRTKLRPLFSVPLSFISGTASSAFGIGGGAVLMPLQVGILKVNVKRAIATTMLVLAVMSGFRVFVISGGRFDPFMALPLAFGALLGAQIGAGIVKRAKGVVLLYILAAFLFLIAFYMALSP